MPNLLVFTAKHKLKSQNNYDDFIAFAKNKLTLFDDHEYNDQKGWECDKWSWMTKSGKKITIVFGISDSRSLYTPYLYGYADFAKAYVRYELSLNFKDSKSWASSLPWLYRALVEKAIHNNKSLVDVMNIDNNVINRTEELINKSNQSTGGKRNIGLSLEKVIIFIKRMRFKLDIQDWKNPFRRSPTTEIKLDKKSREAELDKCPSDYQMLQVADAFYRAETPRQKYFTSLYVMLMCQPSRSIELNGLTIHSLQRTEKGRWYLMWYPAKSGNPVRKWIPKLLEDIVQQAFQRLIEISAPARASAKFADDYPDRFMVHDECITPKYFPQDKPLTFEQFANAIGFSTGFRANGVRLSWIHQTSSKWLNDLISCLNNVPNWRKALLKGYHILPNNRIVKKVNNSKKWTTTNLKIKFPSYKDLLSVVQNQYKSEKFPYYGDAKIWECICLVRDNEFHKMFKVKPFSWVPVGHGMIADALGSQRKTHQSSGTTTTTTSIFEELNITDENGAPLRLTTHQFRHWLNTKLILAGEEDWLIAKWSGRADINQNKDYDGRTYEQKSRLTKRIGPVVKSKGTITIAQVSQLLASYTSESPPQPILIHDLGLPISLKSLGVERLGVAQFTGLGYCVHNYAESPCVKNGDCSICCEHVCLKGMPNTLAELKKIGNLYEEQLLDAKINTEERVFGADRWVTSLGFRLAKLKTIIATLEDPHMIYGKQVRVPDELEISPVKRSLNMDETNTISTLDLTALAMKRLEE